MHKTWKIFCVVGMTVAAMFLSFRQAVIASEIKVNLIDPSSTHVYRAGKEVTITLRPVMIVGKSLKDQIKKIEIIPKPKAVKTDNMDKAEKLMFDGKNSYGTKVGVRVDFCKEKSPRLNIAVELKKPFQIMTVKLDGVNMNRFYGVKNCAMTTELDGKQSTIPLTYSQVRNLWQFEYCSDKGAGADKLILSVTPSGIINLTELEIFGLALEPKPFPSTFQNPVTATCKWVDWHGKPLGKDMPVKMFKDNVIKYKTTVPGYLGLLVTAYGKDGERIFKKEFGFSVTPEISKEKPAKDSPFGMVHHNIDDKYLKVRWVKCGSTYPYFNQKTGVLNAKKWRKAIANIRSRGMEELPIFGPYWWLPTPLWKTDNGKPVTKERLAKLRDAAEQFFRAQPDVLYWELGIEENLPWEKFEKTWPYYWQNLAAKARAVREAANKVNPKIKFIYQIAELRPKSIKGFFESGAAKEFDILSLHPYAWSRYPTPEIWLADFLAQVRKVMRDNNRVIPVWFTEVGAPHHSNHGGFFGYAGANYIRGVERDESVGFMIKCHCIAFGEDVGKIFWYNYRDRGSKIDYPEHHFAIVDYWGYPKPVYSGYLALTNKLNGKKLAGHKIDNGFYFYKFVSPKETCTVMWDSTKKPAQSIKTAAAKAGIDVRKPGVKIHNAVGSPIKDTGSILGTDPVFVTVRK